MKTTKLTKRMKSSLIQIAGANIFLCLLFIWVLIFFSYPRISIIENQKDQLLSSYEELQKIKKSGISFQNLQKQAAESITEQSFAQVLLESVSENFYNTYFLNAKESTYEKYLDELEKNIVETKISPEYKEKIEVFNTILPYYSPKIQINDESLTDIHFINYVEKMLYSFNLQSEGDIGIWNIQKVNQNTISPNSLDEAIYKIPLDLEVTGNKGDFADFIHFLENVWNIKIQDNQVEVYEDEFISKVIPGRNEWEEYNIYENQIVDIESVVLREYPDSSSIKSEEDLVSRLKIEQSREKIEWEIQLNFYVSGLPWYKIEWFISDFLIRFDTVKDEINTNIWMYETEIYKFSEGKHIQALSSLKSLASLIISFEEDIWNIRAQLARGENIWELYDRVVLYSDQLEKIEQKYGEQITLLQQK